MSKWSLVVHLSLVGEVVEVEGDGFFDELADVHVASFGFSLDGFVELGVASERHHRIGLHHSAS